MAIPKAGAYPSYTVQSGKPQFSGKAQASTAPSSSSPAFSAKPAPKFGGCGCGDMGCGGCGTGCGAYLGKPMLYSLGAAAAMIPLHLVPGLNFLSIPVGIATVLLGPPIIGIIQDKLQNLNLSMPSIPNPFSNNKEAAEEAAE
jgi:hypothetical protein